MDTLQMEFWTVLATLSLAVAGTLIIKRRQTRTRKRTAQLIEVRSTLQRHYDSLERFLEDAGAPPKMKDFLLLFSDAISDKEFAIQMAIDLCAEDSALTKRKDSRHEVWADLAALAKHRPDLADEFNAVVATGIVALLTRWPETAEMLDQLLSRILATPSLEARLATKAVQIERKKFTDGLGLNGSPVAA